MNITKASPTDWYRLKASFGPGYIDHPLEIKISHGKEVDSQTGRWREGKELGRGGFGTVRLEREENKGDVRALKLIYKRSIPGGFDYRRELLAMASLDKDGSPFVGFKGWFEDELHLYISMEYFSHGDLGVYIKSQPEDIDIPEKHAKSVARQLLEGLRIMHREGFVHRDLKPQNIFIAALNPIHVKIGDFGITKRAREHESTFLRTQVYTLSYAAPEVVNMDLENPEYTHAVDLWSFGCIIYEMLTKSPPFMTPTVYHRYCDNRAEFPAEAVRRRREVGDCDIDGGVRFLEKLIRVDPRRRMGVKEALAHPWLRIRLEVSPGFWPAEDGTRSNDWWIRPMAEGRVSTKNGERWIAPRADEFPQPAVTVGYPPPVQAYSEPLPTQYQPIVPVSLSGRLVGRGYGFDDPIDRPHQPQHGISSNTVLDLLERRGYFPGAGYNVLSALSEKDKRRLIEQDQQIKDRAQFWEQNLNAGPEFPTRLMIVDIVHRRTSLAVLEDIYQALVQDRYHSDTWNLDFVKDGGPIALLEWLHEIHLYRKITTSLVAEELTLLQDYARCLLASIGFLGSFPNFNFYNLARKYSRETNFRKLLRPCTVHLFGGPFRNLATQCLHLLCYSLIDGPAGQKPMLMHVFDLPSGDFGNWLKYFGQEVATFTSPYRQWGFTNERGEMVEYVNNTMRLLNRIIANSQTRECDGYMSTQLHGLSQALSPLVARENSEFRVLWDIFERLVQGVDERQEEAEMVTQVRASSRGRDREGKAPLSRRLSTMTENNGIFSVFGRLAKKT